MNVLEGFVVSVVNDMKLPVKFIGVGEKIQDLRDFDAEVMHYLKQTIILHIELLCIYVYVDVCRCITRK